MRVALVHVPKVVRVAGELDSLFAMAMPMGLFSLGDRLERSGHEVELVHAGVELQLDRAFSLPRALQAQGAQLVGLSLHWHHQLAEVLAQAEAIRAALPDVTIVLGGLTASTFHREILAHAPAIDAIIRGEAELPLELFARCVERGVEPAEVPNLSWRRDGSIVENDLTWCADAATLSQLGFTRLDLLRHAEYYSGDPWVPLHGEPPPTGDHRLFYLCIGRGCDWECAFCAGCRTAQRLFTGSRGPVLRSAESVCDSIADLHDRGVDSLLICYDPAVAVHSGYFLDLFARLRRAGLRPGLEFECFGLPRPDFVEAFAATFDLDDSKLVLSPGTASERYRKLFHGPRHRNDELEAVLARARALGIAGHVCLSIYPPEGWEDAREASHWQRQLVDRFDCSLFQCPIEMEPWSPWHRDPERFGLTEVRTTFEEFLERHQRPGHHERAWEEEIGYPTRELSARTLLLRSHAEDPAAAVRTALSGLDRRGTTRTIRAPVASLDQVLELLGRWEPGQITLVLEGDADDAAIEELARRITAGSASVARLQLLASRPQSAERAWPAVQGGRSGYRAGPGDTPLTSLVLGDRKDAALFARHLLAQGRELASVLRRRGCAIEDACRFASEPCPALSGKRMCFDEEGAVRGCAALELEHGPGDRWADLVARLAPEAQELERRRGCATCPVASRCARCLAPHPFSEDEYCSLMRSAPTTELCDALLSGRD